MKLLTGLLLFYCHYASSENLGDEFQQRTSKTLFKKLHSKASFLAGYKLGSHFKDRVPIFGNGNLAATSSFNVLGKTISSAFSFSYNNGHFSEPLHDPVSNDTRMGHVVVTTVDFPVLDSEALQKLKQLAKVSENGGQDIKNTTARINNRF